MYCIIRLFTHQRKFVPEIVLLQLKIWNQSVITGRLMHGGTYTWSNTSVKEKGLSTGEGGEVISREIRYLTYVP